MAELNSTPEKSGAKTRSKKAALRVDLTAMVDLAFLLITFFMLTTTLSKPKSLELSMPIGDEPGAQAESRTMTICLGKDNKAMYYLGMADHPIIPPTVTDYSGNGLRKAIFDTRNQVQKATGKSMLVIIKPAETSVYGNLVNTLDEMKITDTQQYAIVDIAPKDISLMKEQQAY
ncbi:MAG: biopolymer transporter ExbD [Bacteroidota bacterium]